MTLTLQHLLKTQQKATDTENTLTAKIAGLDTKLASTETELAATKEDLERTKAKLGKAKNDLNTTQTELSNVKMSLRETHLMANANKAGLVSTNQKVNQNKEDLTSADKKILGLETQTQENVAKVGVVKNDMVTLINETKTSLERRLDGDKIALANIVTTHENSSQKMEKKLTLHKTETSTSIEMVENRIKVAENRFNRSDVTNVEKRGEIYKTVDSKLSNIRCYLHFTFALVASVGAAFVAFIFYIHNERHR